MVEDRLRDTVTRILRAGIELEQFRPVDPELTADHILFLLKQRDTHGDDDESGCCRRSSPNDRRRNYNRYLPRESDSSH